MRKLAMITALGILGSAYLQPTAAAPVGTAGEIKVAAIMLEEKPSPRMKNIKKKMKIKKKMNKQRKRASVIVIVGLNGA